MMKNMSSLQVAQTIGPLYNQSRIVITIRDWLFIGPGEENNSNKEKRKKKQKLVKKETEIKKEKKIKMNKKQERR